jgi:hypothetical protein
MPFPLSAFWCGVDEGTVRTTLQRGQVAFFLAKASLALSVLPHWLHCTWIIGESLTSEGRKKPNKLFYTFQISILTELGRGVKQKVVGSCCAPSWSIATIHSITPLFPVTCGSRPFYLVGISFFLGCSSVLLYKFVH